MWCKTFSAASDGGGGGGVGGDLSSQRTRWVSGVAIDGDDRCRAVVWDEADGLGAGMLN